MAGFEVVESPLRTIWMPVGTSTTNAITLYVGQLISNTIATASSGATAFVQAGTEDSQKPFGVVVGTNNKAPVFDSTYKCEYITSAVTQATMLARKSALLGDGGGMHYPSDSAAFVKVAVIGPCTVLKGRIFAGAYGTALSTSTIGTTSTDGLTLTATHPFTTIAYNSTFTGRTGLNKGISRVVRSASASAPTLYLPFPYDPTAADVFVGANVAQGNTLLTFDALGTYVNGQAAQTAANRVNVLDINLETSGSEYVIFSFSTDATEV